MLIATPNIHLRGKSTFATTNRKFTFICFITYNMIRAFQKTLLYRRKNCEIILMLAKNIFATPINNDVQNVLFLFLSLSNLTVTYFLKEEWTSLPYLCFESESNKYTIKSISYTKYSVRFANPHRFIVIGCMNFGFISSRSLPFVSGTQVTTNIRPMQEMPEYNQKTPCSPNLS